MNVHTYIVQSFLLFLLRNLTMVEIMQLFIDHYMYELHMQMCVQCSKFKVHQGRRSR